MWTLQSSAPVSTLQYTHRTVYTVYTPASHLKSVSQHQRPLAGVRHVRLKAAAVPPTPADGDPAQSTTAGSLQATSGSPADNGTPSGAAAAAAAAPLSGRGHHAAEASPATPSDDDMVALSGRGRFRSILKRAYLGEGLFLTIGSMICVAVAQWTVGTPLRRFNPYSFHVTLDEAPGVILGTPVRMKGVPIGSVLSATPQLQSVSVVVEVNEAKTIIPRGAKFELTQSGLIPAASIDISPPEGVNADVLAATVAASAAAKRGAGRAAVAAGEAGEAGQAAAAAAAGTSAAAPAAPSRAARRASRVRLASPKDVDACRLQGVLVCQGDQLDGLQGGSMDELMGHMLKSVRRGEDEAARAGGRIVPGRGPIQD